MRKLPVLVGTVVALALSVAFMPSSQAQQDRNRSGGENSKEPITIQGVVAEITAEGEIIFDYRHNKAVEAEAAFMTVVGCPKKSEAGGAKRTARATAGADKPGDSDGKHDNVYIVWLTPKTKVCKCSGEKGGEHKEATAASSKSEKKECSLADLEVGDRVEIQFTPRNEDDERQIGHQTAKMRQTHGRDRTYVGIASEVTILESNEGAQSGDKDKERSNR